MSLPPHADTVLVLDLSASISSDTYSRIGGTLAALSRSGERFGLVLFSDDAYEALPPGTPAADLAPFVRYFTLPPQKVPGFAPAFPSNPWQTTFSGGTRISAGMTLAHEIAVAGSGRPTVVLVSDLDDNPVRPHEARAGSARLPARRRTGEGDRAESGAAATSSSSSDCSGSSPAIVQAPTLEQAPPHAQTPFPWTLVALGLAAAALLALRLAWAPRLRWGGS